MKVFIAIALLALIPAIALSQSTINIPADYPTIQQGIDAAITGDTVLVAPGTYLENIDFKGKAITLTSSGGAGVTVIDGGSPVNPDHGSVVTFSSGEGSASVLDGFALTNGTGTYHNIGWWGYFGGGIFCNGASPTLTDCFISHNSVTTWGAGFYNYNGSCPTISHCIISDNSAGNGGGILNVKDSSPIITSCIFRNNTALSNGGAIFNIHDIYATITDCLFISNNSDNHGGAIFNDDSSPTITNCCFIDNEASNGKGGGISGWYGSKVILVNCTFFGNAAASGGGALLSDGGDTLTNCILWGDHPDEIEFYINPTVTYSCVQGGWPGTGNIDADPLFVDPGSNDFHLTYPSPCRNTGDNSAVTELYDFEGDPRIAYGTVDMGADEFYTHLYWTGDATPGGSAALKFVGLPGTSVQLWLGSGVMDPPLPTKYGDWYLQFPLLIQLALGSIPSPDGVYILPFTFPPDTPTPLSLPFQAGIGAELSNLCVLEVE